MQRGDAEMAQKLWRVVRACVELGPKNPIQQIHDQGAGGNCNVVRAPRALPSTGTLGQGADVPCRKDCMHCKLCSTGFLQISCDFLNLYRGMLSGIAGWKARHQVKWHSGVNPGLSA